MAPVQFEFRPFVLSLVAICSSILGVTSAHAASLSEAAVVRGGFNLGDIGARSYDRGAGFPVDTVGALMPFTDGNIRQYGAFNGGPLGQQLEIFQLSELAYYDGNVVPGVANSFGVINADGSFTSVLNSSALNPVSRATYMQGASEVLKFGLRSPGAGLLSGVDSENSGGAAHLLGALVTQNTTITITPNLLRGGTTTFNLMAGDYLLFWEDLLGLGNTGAGGVPLAGDFDYNDLVMVVRATPVPEPTTMLLLGGALLGAAAKRRRKLS